MKASGLVMVDFWAVWCRPLSDGRSDRRWLATEYAGKVKVRKLNTDKEIDTAVIKHSDFLFFKNGQAVEQLVGARPKRQFKEIIDTLLAQHSGAAWRQTLNGMLTELPHLDFGVIERLAVTFGAGFIVFTGETGAENLFSSML